MTDANPSPQAVFAHSLELISSARIKEWVSLFTPDGVLEFPFPLPGFPLKVEGTAALLEHMKRFPEQLEVKFSAPTYYRAADPELVIADFTSEGTALMTGQKFQQAYLSMLWVRDGKIRRYRDFWNPWVIIEALGGPAVFAGPAAG